MPARKVRGQNEKPFSEGFEKAARELECDGLNAFKEKVGSDCSTEAEGRPVLTLNYPHRTGWASSASRARRILVKITAPLAFHLYGFGSEFRCPR
jgi:hypothetical protein